MRKWVLRQGFTLHLKAYHSSQLYRVLQKCSNPKALKQGKQVHQQMIERGLVFDPYLKTKLIQMYVNCDDSAPAIHLFDELPQPNVFAWTAMVSAHLRSGNFTRCLRSYQEIRFQGVSPDVFVFPKVLKACSKLSDLEGGIQIHVDVIRFGSEPNLQVNNSLIAMYSKCGAIEEARQVFDKMVKRDVSSWNSMISGCVCNTLLDSAITLLSLMELQGFEPDLVTWNTIMDAHIRMGNCEKASEIFDRIVEPNSISWTTLMLGYSRSEKHALALSIFRDMIQAGVTLPDADTLSCALSSCRHSKVPRSGREIHGYGIKIITGHEFYDSAGAALLTMYASCKRIQDAKNVFEMMDKHDVVTWNAIILGFSLLGMHDLVEKYFSDMQRTGVCYDQTTIATILPTCDLKKGKQIHARAIKNYPNISNLILNALISMYAKSGCIRTAYNIFSNMGTKDVVSWNTMIGGYGMHGHGMAALQLLQKMKQSGTKPTSVTFTSLLSACSHSGLVAEGLQLFHSLIQEFDFTPGMEHFACVVDLLARVGQLGDAVDFISKMPTKPDRSIWGALLASCRIHQDMHCGRLAAEHLFSLEPNNAGNYVTLANIYARAGKWADSVRVRKLMESRGLLKPSGYSWIENDK